MVFEWHPGLLGRFRSGEREAFSIVYSFYVGRVESFVHRRVLSAGCGRVAAADLVQEVFVRAFSESARLSYDGTRRYGPLLMAIARNAIVDYLRRRDRERQVDPPDLERLLDLEAFCSADEEPWTDPNMMALVGRYLASLPARELAVYEQRYRHGRSQAQAADVLGMSRQRIRTLEARLLAGLAREVAPTKFEAFPRPGRTELGPARGERAAVGRGG